MKPNLIKGQLTTVNVTSLCSEGEGVGKIDKLAVFIEGALPDEIVTAKISEVKSRYAKGQLVSIDITSSSRVSPLCPLFDRCGGCQIMHLDYDKQLEAKRERVAETLKRVGRLDGIEVLPCAPSLRQFGYRNKITLSIQKKNGQLKIGFCERGSHDIVDVAHCDIQDPIARESLSKVRQLLKQSKINGNELKQIVIKSSIKEQKILLVFVITSHDDRKLKELADDLLLECPSIKGVVGHHFQTNKYVTLAGIPFIEETIMGLTFKISAASFFQVNTMQIENLYQTALDFAEIDDSKIILDTYCGIGTLSLIASKNAKKVYGIECVPQTIIDAKENAIINRVNNCHFKCGKTEDLIANYRDIDIVILNPPRQGCNETVFNSLDEIRPHRIVYVSCDPATLARDLALLQKMGYTIEKVRPVDMFPQTMHVETVVKLTYNRQ